MGYGVGVGCLVAVGGRVGREVAAGAEVEVGSGTAEPTHPASKAAERNRRTMRNMLAIIRENAPGISYRERSAT